MAEYKKKFEVYPGGNNGKKECAVEYNRTIPHDLIEKTGLDTMTILRARRELARHIGNMKYLELRSLPEMGIGARFGILDAIMRNILTEQNRGQEGKFGETPKAAYAEWVQKYLEFTPNDTDEMTKSEYPISPYVIRRYSALFGISPDFLLRGDKPTKPYATKANIDDWLT